MRRFLSGLVLVVLATGAPVVAPVPHQPAAASARVASAPPNIVLITTDDQRLSDMSVMPQTLSLIGDAGVRFTSGLSPHPVCCPARAEILTGQYAQNNGVRSTDGINGGFPALRNPHDTIGPWLQDAGYRTGLVGKFLLRYSLPRDGVQPGWDWWDPTIKGIHAYTDFTQANNGEPFAVSDGYITHYVSDRVGALVDEWAPDDRPFFIWESFPVPHEAIVPGEHGVSHPPIPAPEYAGTLAGIPNVSEAAPSFNEADISDKPRSLRRRGLFDDPGRARLQQVFEARLEALLSVDDAVAALVDRLEANGELDNTVIIFTSDNGFMLGEHRYLGKLYGYEEALRVPFLGSAHHQAGGAAELRTIEEWFFGRPRDTWSCRAMLFTDTYNQTNGVAGTMRRVAQRRRFDDVEIVVATSTTDEVDEGVVNFAPEWSVPLPTSEHIALCFPDVLDVLERVGRIQPDVIHVATPGPVGLSGLTVAKLLGIPVVGSYHTELGPYTLHLTRDLVMAQAMGLYVDWFYARCDRVLAPTRVVCDSLVERRVTPSPTLCARRIRKASLKRASVNTTPMNTMRQ